MKKVIVFLPFGFFLLLGVFFLYVLEYRKETPQQTLESALIGKPFPAFELLTLDDTLVTQADLIGEVTLVNVWASWCPSCRSEHAYLSQLVEQGVRIVGLNYKDTASDAKNWLGRYGDNFEFHIQDPAGRLGLDLGVYGAPETYLIDDKGIIIHKRVGVVDARIWRGELGILYRQLTGEKSQ